MQSLIVRWSPYVFALLFLVLLTIHFPQTQSFDLSFLDSDSIQTFRTLSISIILEAFPFVLLGVFISTLLQTFVSEQTIQRYIPKNPVLGVLFACAVGIIFPICECGLIPVIRRLLNKGMPLYIAVVFILVGPIINPVVFTSTFMAFRSRPEMAYSRMAIAFIAAFIIGLVIYRFVQKSPLRHAVKGKKLSHQHHHDHVHTQKRSLRFFSMLGHASDEFFEMGKYLIFGAFLTAIIQILVSRESLVSIGQGQYISHLFMMGFAYIMSLCSTSDAFVASTFATTFSTGSLLTFMVFGPMIDMKGTLMLLSTFRGKFVLKLSLLAAAVVLVVSLIFERLFLL